MKHWQRSAVETFYTDSHGPEQSGCPQYRSALIIEVSARKGSTGTLMKRTFREVLVYLTCNFSPVCIALFTVN